jgi:hypothetical protein
MRAVLFTMMMIAPGLLFGEAQLSVEYALEGGSGACSSSLSSSGPTTVETSPSGVTSTVVSPGASSEILNIGPCTPAAVPVGDGGEPIETGVYVSASAQPFSVAVNGTPGVLGGIDGETDITIFASAEWNGAFEVLGGFGLGFLDFDLQWNNFLEFAGGGLSVSSPLGGASFGGYFCCEDLDTVKFTIPFIFGVPIDYTLSVSQYLPPFEPNSEDVAVMMDNFSIVDAFGADHPADVAEVPEPSAIWLLGVAILLVFPGLSRRTRRRGKMP